MHRKIQRNVSGFYYYIKRYLCDVHCRRNVRDPGGVAVIIGQHRMPSSIVLATAPVARGCISQTWHFIFISHAFNFIKRWGLCSRLYVVTLGCNSVLKQSNTCNNRFSIYCIGNTCRCSASNFPFLDMDEVNPVTFIIIIIFLDRDGFNPVTIIIIIIFLDRDGDNPMTFIIIIISIKLLGYNIMRQTANTQYVLCESYT